MFLKKVFSLIFTENIAPVCRGGQGTAGCPPHPDANTAALETGRRQKADVMIWLSAHNGTSFIELVLVRRTCIFEPVRAGAQPASEAGSGAGCKAAGSWLPLA